jgi:hypothetical protein
LGFVDRHWAGLSGLYGGILPNLASSAPISAIYTTAYEGAKERLLPNLPEVLALLNPRIGFSYGWKNFQRGRKLTPLGVWFTGYISTGNPKSVTSPPVGCLEDIGVCKI